MLHLLKNIWKKVFKNIKYQKVRDHCHYTGKYRGSAHTICNLKSNVLNEAFYNSWNYDYDFIIKELANQFEVEFKHLG